MSLNPFSFRVDKFTNYPSEACIFIGKSSEDQMHCGIVYEDFENSNFNTLHLAWHNDLRNEHEYLDWLSKYSCVHPKIHELRLGLIPAMCTRIVERQKSHKIPYGLLYEGGLFSMDEGIINLGDKASGLTCATFVMAVFKSIQVDLIDIENWGSRLSDKKWHQKVILSLENTKEKYNISDKHIDNVRNEVGCARFRPEEVAISSFFRNRPKKSFIIRFFAKLLTITLN
jgi:hypothetical protein